MLGSLACANFKIQEVKTNRFFWYLKPAIHSFLVAPFLFVLRQRTPGRAAPLIAARQERSLVIIHKSSHIPYPIAMNFHVLQFA
jgi:hypothetical protein